MKLPLRIEYDGDDVFGIYDADNKRIIETDAGFYPPKKEDAEFIVMACNKFLEGK